MITENNSISVEFKHSVEVQKKLSKKLYILSVIMLVVGSVGLAAYIAVSVIYEEPSAWLDVLLVFAVPFALGLVFLLSVRSLIKQARKNVGAVNSYEFFANKLVLKEFRRGAQVAVAAVDYDKIVGVKEKKEFLFIYYPTRAFALPIEKDKLTEEELTTVKKLLRVDVAESAKVLQLSEYNAEVKL